MLRTVADSNVTVQHIQHAFAYAIKQVLVTIRNDRFTQLRPGVFQYLQRVIISLYPSHRTREYRLRVAPSLEICEFETVADRLYPA